MTETTWLVRERRVVSRKINWPGNSRFYLSICHYFYLSLNQTGDLSFFSWCFTWEALLCRYPSSCPLWNDKIIFSSVRENVRSRCLIPPSTSACLGNRTLRSHPPKDIFHVPDFSRGMLHSGYLVYLSIIHMLIQEIFIFNTNKVNPTFLTQVVFNPAAEMNMCTWQDRYHGDCTDKILSSEYSSACSLGHWRPRRLQEGNFWEERELSSGHSPGWCAKTLDRLGLSWLWPESKQKKKKAISNENCVWAPRRRRGPKDLGYRKKTVASGNCVLLETGKFQTSSICTVGEMKKSGEYNSELLQEHLNTEFQSRTVSCTWEQDVSGFPVPGTVLQSRQPHFPRGRCIQPS